MRGTNTQVVLMLGLIGVLQYHARAAHLKLKEDKNTGVFLKDMSALHNFILFDSAGQLLHTIMSKQTQC